MALNRLLSKVFRGIVLLIPFLWFSCVMAMLFFTRIDLTSVANSARQDIRTYKIAHAHNDKLAMHVPNYEDVEYFYRSELSQETQENNNAGHDQGKNKDYGNWDFIDNIEGDNKVNRDVDVNHKKQIQDKARRDSEADKRGIVGKDTDGDDNYDDDDDDDGHDDALEDGEKINLDMIFKNNIPLKNVNNNRHMNKIDDERENDRLQLLGKGMPARHNNGIDIDRLHRDIENNHEDEKDSNHLRKTIQNNGDDEQDSNHFHKANENNDEDEKDINGRHEVIENNDEDKHGRVVNQSAHEPELQDHPKDDKPDKNSSQHKDVIVEVEDVVYDKKGVTWPHVPLSGLGEGGLPVSLRPHNITDKKEQEEGVKKHDFDLFISNRISVKRNLTDARLPECKSLVYPDELPDTSVIVIFRNEAWTTLLRTVHSVMDRSPPHLLREIIMIDDKSEYSYLKRPLEAYMAQFYKVKIYRTKKREGLIRARLAGVERASGQTLTFLDSHCECNVGWLEPLLARIAEDQTHVVTPVIDMVNSNNFGYRKAFTKGAIVGTFNWKMTFKWGSMSNADKAARKNETDPARSPTMAGGLFAINREYFHHIGLYDRGMDVWGAENVELSFRIWMCGGTLEVIPCSRVGHIFRARNPNLGGIRGNPVHRNTLRLVETWLGDLKYLYYNATGSRVNDYGDISERLRLKEKLQCKSFEWYLDNIVPDMFIPSKAEKKGMLQTEKKDICLAMVPRQNTPSQKTVAGKKCLDYKNRIFYLTRTGELRDMELCLDYSALSSQLSTTKCHGSQGNQKWIYTQDRQLRHSTSSLCLSVAGSNRNIIMKTCANSTEQRWYWIDKTII